MLDWDVGDWFALFLLTLVVGGIVGCLYAA